MQYLKEYQKTQPHNQHDFAKDFMLSNTNSNFFDRKNKVLNSNKLSRPSSARAKNKIIINKSVLTKERSQHSTTVEERDFTNLNNKNASNISTKSCSLSNEDIQRKFNMILQKNEELFDKFLKTLTYSK